MRANLKQLLVGYGKVDSYKPLHNGGMLFDINNVSEIVISGHIVEIIPQHQQLHCWPKFIWGGAQVIARTPLVYVVLSFGKVST